MTVSFELPESIARPLQRDLGDLDTVAKEALAIEAFRAGKLSLGQFAQMLVLSTYEADALLKLRGVDLDITDDELQQEIESLRRLIG